MTPAPTIDALLTRLRAALRTRSFTKRSLAAASGLHPNTLLGCEGDGWNPSLHTLRKIEAQLLAAAPQNVPELGGSETGGMGQ